MYIYDIYAKVTICFFSLIIAYFVSHEWSLESIRDGIPGYLAPSSATERLSHYDIRILQRAEYEM